MIRVMFNYVRLCEQKHLHLSFVCLTFFGQTASLKIVKAQKLQKTFSAQWKIKPIQHQPASSITPYYHAKNTQQNQRILRERKNEYYHAAQIIFIMSFLQQVDLFLHILSNFQSLTIQYLSASSAFCFCSNFHILPFLHKFLFTLSWWLIQNIIL